MINLADKNMKWSKKKPKKDGWYFWRRYKRYSEYLWEAYFCEVENNLNHCWESGTEVYWPKRGWWAGPIPKPKS